MATLKKSLVALAVALAVAGTTNLVQANCGVCGTEEAHPHDHAHEKETCVRCEHAKTCNVEDCRDAAHFSKCTCVKEPEDDNSNADDYLLPE